MNAADLMQQAKDTAHDYARRARDDAAELFPALTPAQRVPIIAAMMQAAALDYLACWMTQELKIGLDDLTESQLEISASIKECVQGLDDMAAALDRKS